jgi:hypothetical protein
MIVIPKKTKNIRSKIHKVARYVLRLNTSKSGLAEGGFLNEIISKSKEDVSFEMAAWVNQLDSSRIPAMHWIISFANKNEEEIARRNVKNIVEEFIEILNFKKLLTVYGAHEDTDHFHIHTLCVTGDIATEMSHNRHVRMGEKIQNAVYHLCQKFGFESPLNDFKEFYDFLDSTFSASENWEEVFERLEMFDLDIANHPQGEKCKDFLLKSGEWDHPLSKMIGRKKTERFFDLQGPIPPLTLSTKKKVATPKKQNAPQKKQSNGDSNFWLVKKKCRSVLKERYSKKRNEIEKKIFRLNKEIENLFDEYLVFALYDKEKLLFELEEQKKLFFESKAVLRKITFEKWNLASDEIEPILLQWMKDEGMISGVNNILEPVQTKSFEMGMG